MGFDRGDEYMKHSANLWLLLLAFLFIRSGSVIADSKYIFPGSPAFSVEAIKNNCIEFANVKVGNEPDDIADCRVSDAGVTGTVNNQVYYYAIYCMMPGYSMEKGGCASASPTVQYYQARGLAVFVGNGQAGKASLLMERADQDVGLKWYEKPELIVNSFGTLLYLPIHLDGTGAGNLSEYFILDEETKQWQKLDTESWVKAIKIPSRLSINKGIWPDLKNMSAVAHFYRSKDANCCPTGGTAQFKLAIENRRLLIKSETFKLEQADENN